VYFATSGEVSWLASLLLVAIVLEALAVGLAVWGLAVMLDVRRRLEVTVEVKPRHCLMRNVICSAL